jgi:hypothetical protein
MTNTLKFLLVGGAVVGVVLVARKMAAAQTAAAKPSGAVAVAQGAAQVYDALKTFAASAPVERTTDGTQPYSPRVADYSAIADATGTRALRPLVMSDTVYSDLRLSGIHS